MRAFAPFVIVSLLLAGCAGGQDPAREASDQAVEAEPARPEPVSIHEVVPLATGAQTTWSFQVEPGATTVDIRFYATGSAVVAGGGLPACLTIETPEGSASAGNCVGGGQNLVVAPYVVVLERVFYERSGADAAVGSYQFTLDADQSATDFHAMVTVEY